MLTEGPLPVDRRAPRVERRLAKVEQVLVESDDGRGLERVVPVNDGEDVFGVGRVRNNAMRGVGDWSSRSARNRRVSA